MKLFDRSKYDMKSRTEKDELILRGELGHDLYFELVNSESITSLLIYVSPPPVSLRQPIQHRNCIGSYEKDKRPHLFFIGKWT